MAEEQVDAFPVEERKDKMRYVLLTDIIVGDRFRKDYGDMEEFKTSILEKGIIQPISLDSNLNLLAGGRRYAGATAVGLKKIPCIIREVSDGIDALEIELMENVHRKDFTWNEEARLIYQIDTLYKTTNRNWSGRKTAELLDKSVANVARNIQLAKAMEFLPELTCQRTADDALKMLKKIELETLTAELISRQQTMRDTPEVLWVDTTNTPGGVTPEQLAIEKGVLATLKVAEENYKIGDCFSGMAKLRTSGHIDFIECDPPYGINLNSQKGSKDTTGSTVTDYEEVSSEHYPEFLRKLTEELFRVAGKDCWMVFWYGPTWADTVLRSLRNAGWLVDEIPVIWAKYAGQTLQPELYLARAYEPFYICRKGKPLIHWRGHLNVYTIQAVPSMGPEAKYHPTQRPVKLITDLYKTFLIGPSKIFIPFLGSGTSLRACYYEGHQGFGFDLDGRYKDKFLLKVEADTRALMEAPNAAII